MHPARKAFTRRKPRMVPCKICKEPYPRERMSQVVCGVPCAITHDQATKTKALERKAQRAAREEKATTKANRKAVKELNRRDLSWQHKRTQQVFNRMRVLEELKWFRDRGLEPTCISCGKPNMDWCCGHFKTVGAQGILRYDHNNTFLQCNRNCNMGLSGNIDGNRTSWGLKRGIILRFGEELGYRMRAHCEMINGIKKWTCEELEQARARYAAKIRELEREST